MHVFRVCAPPAGEEITVCKKTAMVTLPDVTSIYRNGTMQPSHLTFDMVPGSVLPPAPRLSDYVIFFKTRAMEVPKPDNLMTYKRCHTEQLAVEKHAVEKGELVRLYSPSGDALFQYLTNTTTASLLPAAVRADDPYAPPVGGSWTSGSANKIGPAIPTLHMPVIANFLREQSSGAKQQSRGIDITSTVMQKAYARIFNRSTMPGLRYQRPRQSEDDALVSMPNSHNMHDTTRSMACA